MEKSFDVKNKNPLKIWRGFNYTFFINNNKKCFSIDWFTFCKLPSMVLQK